MATSTRLIQQQLEYYRARATEYDQWFYRQGRYDHGEEPNQQWFREVDMVRQALHQLPQAETILELACGTGIWTQELLRQGEQIIAIDASSEMIEINRHKLADHPAVSYQQHDLFVWNPDRTYDLVFFSFWLSHVPGEQLHRFFSKVRQATRPGGRVFIIDSRLSSTASANDHHVQQANDVTHLRRLNDGREYEIVKVFYGVDSLQAILNAHDFSADVHTTPNYFIYANAVRRDD